MPFSSKKAPIKLDKMQIANAEKIMKTPSETLARAQRAGMILHSFRGETVSEISRAFSTNRPKVERTLDKAREFGFESALNDLPRSGRNRVITEEARLWITSLACQKPKSLGYPHELWTYDLLVQHIRKECLFAGYPMLVKFSQSTLSEILLESNIRPHKISYYLERRDPDFKGRIPEKR